MKTAILIHGMPSKEEYFSAPQSPSNAHWIPWIQRQLLLKGVLAQAPEMPEPFRPNYEEWRKMFEQFDLNEETVLVGHSCGGGFLMRWLSENKVNVGKVVLVAPWINPHDSRPVPGFFDFNIDSGLVSRTKGITLFISSDDDKDELDTAVLLRNTVKDLKLVEFKDKGHFTFNDLKSEEFPELLSELV